MKRLALILLATAAPAAATYPGAQPFVWVQSSYDLQGTGSVDDAIFDNIGPAMLLTTPAQPGFAAYSEARFGALKSWTTAGLGDSVNPARFSPIVNTTPTYAISSLAGATDLQVTGATSYTGASAIYFDRTLSASLNPNRANYLEDLLAYDSFYNYDPSTVIEAGRVNVNSYIQLFRDDYDQNGVVVGSIDYSVQDSLQYSDVAFVYNGVAYSVSYADGVTFESLVSIDALGNRTVLRSNFTPFDPLMPFQLAQDYAINLLFEAGHSYSNDLRVGCSTSTSLVGYQAGTASCDASKSVYWNGLTNVLDLNGRPLTKYTLTSASGFDYRYASPFSPAPVASPPPPSAIPEPAAWALLLVGFGVIGAVQRRPFRNVRTA